MFGLKSPALASSPQPPPCFGDRIGVARRSQSPPKSHRRSVLFGFRVCSQSPPARRGGASVHVTPTTTAPRHARRRDKEGNKKYLACFRQKQKDLSGAQTKWEFIILFLWAGSRLLRNTAALSLKKQVSQAAGLDSCKETMFGLKSF